MAQEHMRSTSKCVKKFFSTVNAEDIGAWAESLGLIMYPGMYLLKHESNPFISDRGIFSYKGILTASHIRLVL